MATTTNYGWTTPDDTDLVKDGAAAIRSLGTAIDTSFVADEGDLLVGGTSDIFEALPIGAAGTVLTSDGDTAEWAAPGGAGANWTLLNSGGTALTGAQTVTVSGISGADKILVIIQSLSTGATNTDVGLRLNTDTGSNYNLFGAKYNGAPSYSAAVFGTRSNTSTNFFELGAMTSNAGSSFNGYIFISGANSSGVKVVQSASGVSNNVGNDGVSSDVAGFYNDATVISSISVVTTGGSNFDAGTVFVYTSA
jgi:hypothetical protein